MRVSQPRKHDWEEVSGARSIAYLDGKSRSLGRFLGEATLGTS